MPADPRSGPAWRWMLFLFERDSAMRVARLLTTCLLGAAMLPVVAAQPASAQARGAGSSYETRTELQQELRDLEERLAELEEGSDRRDSVQQQITRMDRRLEQGDFRTGDAVEIRVPRSDTLSGVFQVEPGPRLRVPTIGEIDLDGVLYAEADSVIGEHLRRYVRAERMEVRPLKRVAVLGAVGDPGYYDVPPSITVSDLLMRAGGPTQSSELEKLELRRDGRTLASADKGLRESATLAELGVERGDQVRVPQQSGGTSFGTIMSVVGAVSTLTFAATRIF